MTGTLKNYYEILGVPRSATADEIRTAYRKLLLKFHPDKNIGDIYFEDWSKKINEAFEVLMSPEIRSEYDQVYDETKASWKQAASTAREGPADVQTETEEPEASVDFEIQKLAPVYISAKQAYIRAERNVAGIEARMRKKRMNPVAHFIAGGIMLLAILVWVVLTRTTWQVAFSKPDLQPPAQASVAPLPLPHNPVETNTANLSIAENVDLWLKVTATKTYFLEEPGGEMLDAKFLSRGNKLHAIKRSGNYYYGIFQSAVNTSYKIEGWVKSIDVEIVAQ